MMIDIRKTRLGKKTDRYTSKTLAKKPCHVIIKARNDFAATFITILNDDENERTSLRVELTEKALREALKTIESHKKMNQGAHALLGGFKNGKR